MTIQHEDFKTDLRQIYQYEDYQYSARCCCPECVDSYGYGEWIKHSTEGIVGYCVLQDGSYQLCLECPECHTKWRYHYAERWVDFGVFDVEYWKKQVGLVMYLEEEKK